MYAKLCWAAFLVINNWLLFSKRNIFKPAYWKSFAASSAVCEGFTECRWKRIDLFWKVIQGFRVRTRVEVLLCGGKGIINLCELRNVTLWRRIRPFGVIDNGTQRIQIHMILFEIYYGLDFWLKIWIENLLYIKLNQKFTQ